MTNLFDALVAIFRARTRTNNRDRERGMNGSVESRRRVFRSRVNPSRDKYPGMTINNHAHSRCPYITFEHIVRDVRETNLIRRRGGAPPFVSARVNIAQERAAVAAMFEPREFRSVSSRISPMVIGAREPTVGQGTRERIIHRSREGSL